MLFARRFDIHCKMDDSPWYSAASARALCAIDRSFVPCASREMFEILMASHRAGDLCARCREIIEAVDTQEDT